MSKPWCFWSVALQNPSLFRNKNDPRPDHVRPTEDARDGVRDIIGHYEELLQECVRVENEKYDARLAEGERLAVFWVSFGLWFG